MWVKSRRRFYGGFVLVSAESLERRVLLSGLSGTGTTLQSIAGEAIDVGDIVGTGAVYVPAGANVSVDSINEPALTIGGTLSLATPGESGHWRGSYVDVLDLTPAAGITGTLDLTNNVLFIDYGSGTDPIATIRSYVLSGYDGDTWAGTGIVSSVAAESPQSHAVGYADGADGIASGLPAGMIEVKYTLAGDANLDGIVNGSDFYLMSANFNDYDPKWDAGDFNYDNVVNGSDFTLLSANMNQALGVWPASLYTVPAQYAATFTDNANTPLADLSATVDWGDSSTPTAGAIVGDGNGTFHVIANHSYANAGDYQVTTTITDSDSNSTTEVYSNAIVSSVPLSAEPLDAYDIQLNWIDQPILSSGQILQYSDDPTFSTDVQTANLSGGVTDYIASNLSPSTTYYFQLSPSESGSPIFASASATTDPSDGNGGTSGPTAPTITEAATISQPSNTTLSLTMAASSAAGDPISYNWQLISGPGGPPPELTNSEQTTTVLLSAAGTYNFQGTATDDSTGLSVVSDASDTVNQVATSIVVSPPTNTVAPNGTVELSAIENDQFGQTMSQQPQSFSWSTDDASNEWTLGSLGSINSYGLFTASQYSGMTTAVASANGVEGGAAILVGGTISSPSPSYTTQFYCGGPVDDLQCTVEFLSNHQANATLDIAGDGVYSTTVNIPYDNSQFQQVDLSTYSNVTGVFCQNPGCEVGYETYTMLVPGVFLGNGSSSQIIQGSNTGTQNLVPLYLTLPPNLSNGTPVTLSTTNSSAAGEIDVWNSPNPTPGSTPILGGSAQTSSVTWTVGTDSIPTTLYIGATKGSTNVNDIQFKWSIDPVGGGAPVSYGASQYATAVKVDIIAENDPNNVGIQGQNIAGQTNNWLVGQMVDVNAVVEAPAAWLNNLTYSWTAPGNNLIAWNQSGTTAGIVPLQPDYVQAFDEGTSHSGTQDQNLQFFWVSTNGNPATEKVQVTVGNINGSSLSTSTTFDVNEPSVVPVVTAAGPVAIMNNAIYANATNNAFIYSANVTTPGFAVGTWTFLQLVSIQDIAYQTVNNNNQVQKWVCVQNGITELDTAFPYPFINDSQNNQVANLSTGDWGQMVDYPYLPLNSASFFKENENDIFSDYIMYKPPGQNSAWVPIGAAQWSFGGIATFNGTAWQLTSAFQTTGNIDPPPTAEPTWGLTIIGSSLTWIQSGPPN